MVVITVITPKSLRIAEVFTIALGLGLTTLAITTRIYVKWRILRKFLSEDYFSIAAYAGYLSFLALAIVIGTNSGDIRHKAFLSVVESLLYEPTIVLVKTSILLQFVTVFVVNRRNFFHYLIHVIIWGNAIFYIIISLLFIFRCEPRRKLWLPQTPGKCHNSGARGILSGAGNVVTDLLILILPLPVLLRLQMPLKKKLRCASVFGIGFFACLASIVRFVYSFHVTNKTDPRAYQLNVNRQGLLASAEIAIGIIVGCIPSVHKYFRHISKNGSGINFRIPYISGSSSSGGGRRRGPYWRKLFARSWSSGANRPRKLSASTDSGSGSGSPAPHIKTLNMTRASFTLDEKGHIPIMPPEPEPVYVQTGGNRGMNDDYDARWEKVQDLESGMRGAGAGTHEREHDESKTPVRGVTSTSDASRNDDSGSRGIDDASQHPQQPQPQSQPRQTIGGRGNMTMRAQYEVRFHPRG